MALTAAALRCTTFQSNTFVRAVQVWQQHMLPAAAAAAENGHAHVTFVFPPQDASASAMAMPSLHGVASSTDMALHRLGELATDGGFRVCTKRPRWTVTTTKGKGTHHVVVEPNKSTMYFRVSWSLAG